MHAQRFLHDEQGFTTAGMAIAITLALTLIFSGAQIYRVTSAAAEIQEVADASVLAAQNEVAEFMVAARMADASVLSMTLLSLSLYGLGAVALCTPLTAPFSEQLIAFGTKTLDARNVFADKVAKGLNLLQKALPFIAAVKAASVAVANNDSGGVPADYFAVAVLVPIEGKEIKVPAAEGVKTLGKHVEENADDIKSNANAAETAAQKANEAKQRGFMSDCGANPAECMYERAERLAGLSGAANPLYRSAETWSFSVALKRAQAYYSARRAQELPASSSTAEQARSVLRKRFYAYACETMAGGYVHESESSFSCNFPLLFKNTSEMRATALYTETIYPITAADKTITMHAWTGCPLAENVQMFGSIAQLETGTFVPCPACEFSASSMGNVAAASSAIDNGFEYHYRRVAAAATEYQKYREEQDRAASKVKNKTTSIFDTIKDLIKNVSNARIHAQPPGNKGAIALVVNRAQTPADSGFESMFAPKGYTLGVRAAVSGATLIPDKSDNGRALIKDVMRNSMGLVGGSGLAGVAGIVADAWSALLVAFSDGQTALVEAVTKGLNALPLVSASGLGTWAGKKITSTLNALGLQPPELDVLKPVLVNTAHVAGSDSGAFSVGYKQVQQRARAISGTSTDLFSAVIDNIESEAYKQLEKAGKGIEIAKIDFPIGNEKIPIILTLPPSVMQAGESLIDKAVSALRSAAGSITSGRVWS